jgi:hypothetical protein
MNMEFKLKAGGVWNFTVTDRGDNVAIVATYSKRVETDRLKDQAKTIPEFVVSRDELKRLAKAL